VTAETTTLGISARPPRRWLRAFGPILAAVLVLAPAPVWLGDSRLMMGLAVDALLFGAYAIAFNLIFGSTNQLFLCMGALAGVGGYTSGIISDSADIPLLLGAALSAAGAGLLGGLISWVAVRRSLDVIFTGIVTLAFSLSFHNLVLGQRDVTGGETGLLVTAGRDSFLSGRVAAYYTFLGVVAIYLLVFRLLQRSHIGWAFRAIRDDETAAELAGVNVARYRIYAGIIGSSMLGLAGALFAYHKGFISPSTFEFGHVDVRVLVMLAFGGLGTLLGPVIGSVVFAFLDEWLIEFGQLREVVYGVLIIVLFLGFRRGFVPAVGDFFNARFRSGSA
jgi:branched-chain amino acid transport system permease protein